MDIKYECRNMDHVEFMTLVNEHAIISFQSNRGGNFAVVNTWGAFVFFYQKDVYLFEGATGAEVFKNGWFKIKKNGYWKLFDRQLHNIEDKVLDVKVDSVLNLRAIFDENLEGWIIRDKHGALIDNEVFKDVKFGNNGLYAGEEKRSPGSWKVFDKNYQKYKRICITSVDFYPDAIVVLGMLSRNNMGNYTTYFEMYKNGVLYLSTERRAIAAKIFQNGQIGYKTEESNYLWHVCEIVELKGIKTVQAWDMEIDTYGNILYKRNDDGGWILNSVYHGFDKVVTFEDGFCGLRIIGDSILQYQENRARVSIDGLRQVVPVGNQAFLLRIFEYLMMIDFKRDYHDYKHSFLSISNKVTKGRAEDFTLTYARFIERYATRTSNDFKMELEKILK